MPYQEGIYTTDEGKIPDYIANITPPQGVLPAQTIPPDSATKISVVETVNESLFNLDVNRRLYQLILSIQSRILDCDHEGNVLAGLLPFTSQATLYMGEIKIDIRGEIIRYPGTGNDLFDPMLGGVAPVINNNDIEFSLINAPQGVTINENGLITVGASAALSAENYITVVAKFFGQPYTTTLYIKRGIYTPRYLGACYTPPTGTNTVLVKKGVDTVTVVAWQGDWVSYLGETLQNSIWENGAVMRWDGTQWEKVDPMSRSDSALYIAAMDDLLEGAPNATFLYAIIGKIFTRHIVMTQDGMIESSGFDGVNGQTPGFRFSAINGLLEAIGAKFRELTVRGGTFDEVTAIDLKVTNGNFSGINADAIRISGDSSFSGNIDSGVLKVLPSSATSFSLIGPANRDATINFMNNVRSTLGYPSNIEQFTIFPTSGTYRYYYDGSYINQVIYSLTFVFSGYMTSPHIMARSANGTSNRIDYIDSGNSLNFIIGTSARTLRFQGLPTSTNNQYEVYKWYNANDAKTYLLIKE